MSGGKGSSSTPVTSTATQTNPLAKYVQGAADYLTPYAQDPNRPYTAPINPYQTAGYNDIANTAGNVQGWPTARSYDAYGNLITGGGTSPAYGGYAQMAAGGSGPQQTSDRVVNNAVNAAYGYGNTIADYGNKAAASGQGYGSTIADYANRAIGGSPGTAELEDVASGKYLGTNPYSASVLQNILDPITRNFQTSVMPSIDAAAAKSGRYGSGAQLGPAGLYGNAQTTLGNQLGQTTEQFGFDQYKSERAAMDAAAQNAAAGRRADLSLGITGNQAAAEAARLGYGTGITGNQYAGNLVDQGERTALNAADLTQRGQTTGLAGLDTGFRTGLTTQEAALRDFPSFIQSLFAPGTATAGAGTALRALDQSLLSEPYDKVNAYLKAISGGGSPGSSTSSTTPYYTNDVASALSAGSGALNLGKQLGIGGGTGGLFGAGGTLGSQGPLFGSLADASIAAGGPPLAAELATTAGLEGIPAAAATAGFWIVCTELMRQGRMKKAHYLAGWPVFAAYPERGKNGYYIWAIPLVRHLRHKPDSLLSRATGAVFRWRAEDIAARAGVKGARKLWRGRAVTAVLYPLCAALGWFVAPQDWAAVYREEQIACSQ